jgi:hypothetical protein
VFAQAAQLKVGLVEAPVEPFIGEGLEGVPGVGHGSASVVNDHTGPEVEFPQVFLATIFQ